VIDWTVPGDLPGAVFFMNFSYPDQTNRMSGLDLS